MTLFYPHRFLKSWGCWQFVVIVPNGIRNMVAVATSPGPTNVRHWDSSLINDFGRKPNTWSIFGNPQKWPFSYSFFTHRRFYRQTLLHADACTRRRFYTHTLLHADACTTADAFTRRRYYTQTLIHTDTFTPKTLLHTDGFYTQTLLHTEAFTHRRFYTQTLLHTDAFTRKRK